MLTKYQSSKKKKNLPNCGDQRMMLSMDRSTPRALHVDDTVASMRSSINENSAHNVQTQARKRKKSK